MNEMIFEYHNHNTFQFKRIILSDFEESMMNFGLNNIVLIN